MLETKKIYVVGNQKHYAKFITNGTLVDNIADADVIVFTGGEDVDPSLYGCKPHCTTYSNLARDLEEKAEFEKIRPDQLVVGICRGSQLLCVLNGGKLVQDVTGHALYHTHRIYEVATDKVYEITSTHHQMQYPFNLNKKNYTLLAISSHAYSNCYEGDGIDFVSCEPEIVLYQNPRLPKCLAIQGHPEYMRAESPIVIRINELIDDLLITNK